MGSETEDDTYWLPSQLLQATNSIMTTGNEDTIINVLRLFLSMSVSEHCTLNGRLLIEMLQRCGECYESNSRSIRAASLATASQCLRSFCSFLKDEADELIKTAPAAPPALSSAVYNECLPVMSWLSSKLINNEVK